MTVWVLSDGETLPGQGEGRKMRSWMLCEALVARGHEVVWWASTFLHHRRRLVADRDLECVVSPRLTLRLLHCGAYNRSVSYRRYRHHRRLGGRFAQVARRLPAPNAIVAAFPKIEMAYQAVLYTDSVRVPIVVDVRDLWPETYLGLVPRPLRPIVRVALDADFKKSRHVFRSADSLVSMSQGVLDWALGLSGRHPTSSDRVFPIGYPHDLVPVSRETAERPAFLRTADSRVVFAYVGAFGASYELATICNVARELHRAGNVQVHFVLAGEGARLDEVARSVAGLQNVTLTGWLSHPDVRTLLAHSDVGLIPWNSIPGAMPNKVFEYLAAGLPVVSSLVGEMAQLIAAHQIGASYEAGNVPALRAIVEQLAADDRRRFELSRNARALYESKFRSDAIYGAYAMHVERVSGLKAADAC